MPSKNIFSGGICRLCGKYYQKKEILGRRSRPKPRQRITLLNPL
jgi:hypothetical protein